MCREEHPAAKGAKLPNPGVLPPLKLLHVWEMGIEPARGGPSMGDRDTWLRMHHLSTVDISPSAQHPKIPAPSTYFSR